MTDEVWLKKKKKNQSGYRIRLDDAGPYSRQTIWFHVVTK